MSEGFDSKSFLKALTHRPGVYRMLGPDREILYVGKAKDLRKRVSSYFRRNQPSPRIASMVRQIQGIEVTVTNTEAEALLLESNLIKQHRPRYNVIFRDDKSYPYIYMATEHPFPRLGFHRGARRGKGRYFGPYPSAAAVRETLDLLQKVFRVRQCEDSFYNNRSRPCLQYQIKRCAGPCVGLVSAEDYAQDVAHTIQFLEGRSSDVIDDLVRQMDAAAEQLKYERAAVLRDQIENLRKVASQQYVTAEAGDVDLFACEVSAGSACVQVFNIRHGHNLGNRSYFPGVPGETGPGEILTAVIAQYYLNREVPGEILASHALMDEAALAEMLSDKQGRKVSIATRLRGTRARWMKLARQNAQHALAARLALHGNQQARIVALQEALGLEAPPARIECFDISHTQGEATVASCVVFGPEGPVKSAYRRFNIEGIEPGDDYGAMKQALTRRYARLVKGEGTLPDVLLIDGGRGQVRQALDVLTEQGVQGVRLIGVAKGEGRRPELDRLVLSDAKTMIKLPGDSKAMHLIQQVRDEAHRFAITGHRAQRARRRSTSPLEQIAGLGPKRRQALLRQFGGLRGVTQAGVEELAKVPGISKHLAQQVYDHFHSDA